MLLSFREKFIKSGSVTRLDVPLSGSATSQLVHHLSVNKASTDTSKAEGNLIVVALHIACLAKSVPNPTAVPDLPDNVEGLVEL